MPHFGEVWGHTGFIKSFMLYWPEGNTTICGTLNQATAKGIFSHLRPVSSLVKDVLVGLSNAQKTDIDAVNGSFIGMAIGYFDGYSIFRMSIHGT